MCNKIGLAAAAAGKNKKNDTSPHTHGVVVVGLKAKSPPSCFTIFQFSVRTNKIPNRQIELLQTEILHFNGYTPLPREYLYL